VVESVSFYNVEENDYSLTKENTTEYLDLGASGGPEYFDYEDEVIEEEVVATQIILSSDMVVDEVEGGSLYSPALLVDEQSSTPENELHPSSKEWKPAWNMSNGPYHMYIDLGAEYQLSEIALHDTYNAYNLDVSIGEPDNWTLLFTESCDGYKTWKQHDVDVSTRYIRFSMNESVNAAINEIVLYGYSDETIISEKSATISEAIEVVPEETLYDEDLELIQNPVKDLLRLKIPEELSHNFTIEVHSLNGSLLVSEYYAENKSSVFGIDISERCVGNGIYVMRYINDSGVSKTIKFIKSSL
jgi:hypothetical protein